MKHSRLSSACRRTGAALVIVLLMIVLLTVLVVSYFIDVRTESVAAGNYSERSRVKMLADSAENLAIGQIQKATEGRDEGGSILAWASQPGMIRTWDDAGQPVKAYKLYSADKMVVNGHFNSDADIAADVPADWKSNPAEFTDLNAPVLVEDSNGPISQNGSTYSAHFPIISGNHLKGGSYAGKGVQTYEAQIEGFGVEGQPSVSEAEIRPDNNPIPMPVRWLYVLKDGTLAPVSGNAVAGATTDNPIVGRIAFWTDDDTCKLNINTASEGAYWSRPRTTSATEKNLSQYIPAQNEFATFPGHPATTSLSPVLGSLFPVSELNGIPNWMTATVYNQFVPYYKLTPRVGSDNPANDGSKGATRTPTTAQVVNYDADRLYASVDEFMFKAERSENAPGEITNDFLEQARFFLTAHSRAPEVNMFNLPRISLWPLDPQVRNAKDKLLAYCSTINHLPYYFQRTVVPGKNPDLSAFSETSQSPTKDWDRYGRNKQLYNYLQKLTSARIPGFGGKLSDKYPGNYRNQILTEMVDYLRSGVNIASTSTTGNDTPYYFVPPGGTSGGGQVIPLTLNSDGSGGSDTRGFGRFITISEGALVLFKPDANNLQAFFMVEPYCPSPGLPPINPCFTIKVEGLDQFMINGHSLWMPATAQYVCDAIQVPTVVGQPNTYPAGSTAFPATRLMFYKKNGASSDAPRTDYPFVGLPFAAPPGSGGGDDPTYSLTGGPVTITISGPNGEEVQKLTLNFRNTSFKPIANAKPLEPATIPVPEAVSKIYYKFPTQRIPPMNSTDIKQWLIRKVTGGSSAVNAAMTANPKTGRGDVVRSMEANPLKPLGGDLRALALVTQDNTGAGDPLFVRHPFYDWNPEEKFLVSHGTTDRFLDYQQANSVYRRYNLRFAESLRSDEIVYDGQFGGYSSNVISDYALNHAQDGRKGTMMTGGSLIQINGPAADLQRDAVPCVPYGVNGAFLGADPSNGYGDWDTGLGANSDGPFINYPDQGNSATTTTGYELAVSNKSLFVGGYFGRGDWRPDSGATFSPNRQIASAVSFGSLSAWVDPKDPADMQAWRTLLFCPNPAAQTMGSVIGIGTTANTTHASKLNHPGFGKPIGGSNPYPPYSEPPDHAFLDLFTMPIVEGYPISEPMSTAGKVNMNYQIAPFTYIHRSTAIRGVLKNERLTAIPTTAPTEPNDDNAYKSAGSGVAGWTTQIRYGIYLDEGDGTLRQFEARFKKGDLFRSASEICDMFLVPRVLTGSPNSAYPVDGKQPVSFGSGDEEISFTGNNVAKWWDKFLATGDNLREEPYGRIYPRLTTKSNSYTIYVRVQSLKKSPNTPAGTFVDPASGGKTDTISGEYRGSFEIERYLDPNELEKSGIDFATAGLGDANANLGKYYKFRTISAKEFRP